MSSISSFTRGVVGSSLAKTHISPPRRIVSKYVCARYISSTSDSVYSSASHSKDWTTSSPPLSQGQPDLHTIFAKPSWSVRSLLPDNTTTTSSPSSSQHRQATESPITPKTLHHLLRLSALPLPSTPEEESSMLQTLHTQLHFVQDIQSVNTAGVTPLRAIRDETSAGVAEVTVSLASLQAALDRESPVGHRRRPRRNRGGERTLSEEEVLVEKETRDRRERGYFLVDKGKAKGGE